MLRFGRILLCLGVLALWGFSVSCTEEPTEPEPTRPDAPSNLAGAAVDTSRISLSWQDNSSNEEGFQVYVWDGVQWGIIGTTDANTAQDTVTGLWPGTEYSFRVKAFNDMGESNFSNSAEVTTEQIEIPSAPENLTLRPLDYNRILVSWRDNSTNETGFNVQRREQSGNFADIAFVSANDTFYADISLEPQTLYHYRVGAIGRDGTSWTDSDTARTWPFEVPSGPVDLQVDVIMGVGIALSWLDRSSHEQHFIIARSDNGTAYEWIDTLTANTVGYLDPSVFSTHRYAYFVVASNTVGFSDSSNVVTAYYGYYSKGAIPLADVNYWLYDVSDTIRDYTYIEKVSRVELFNTVPWFLIHKENRLTFEVDSTTFLRNEDNDEDQGVLFRREGFTQGELLWKYPAVEDDFFYVEGDCVLVEATDEDVEVPEGRYQDCYVYSRFAADGTTIETVIKPEIGIVRVRKYDGFELIYEQELNEYVINGPE